jgi:hypothetical protein
VEIYYKWLKVQNGGMAWKVQNGGNGMENAHMKPWSCDGGFAHGIKAQLMKLWL